MRYGEDQSLILCIGLATAQLGEILSSGEAYTALYDSYDDDFCCFS